MIRTYLYEKDSNTVLSAAQVNRQHEEEGDRDMFPETDDTLRLEPSVHDRLSTGFSFTNDDRRD
jgi:hypothetical protein